MANITPDQVREVIKTDLTDSEISGLITTAVAMYDSKLSSQGLTEALEVEIKRYLTAHYVAIKDPSPTVKDVTLGDARESYETIGNVASQEGLKATRWGQMAIALDPSGTLTTTGGVRQRLRSL